MRKWALPVILAVLVVAAFAVGSQVREQLGFSFSVEGLTDLRQWVDSLGWRGPAVFVALVTFRTFLMLSSHLVLVLGGLVFGTLGGTLWGALGLILSAHLQFLAARLLGDAWVRPRLGKHHAVLEDRIRRLGPAPVWAITAHPAGPQTPVNLAAGLVGLPIWEFALAVVLAAPLRAGAYSLLGTGISSWGLAASLAVGLGLAVLLLVPLLIPTVRNWILGTRESEEAQKAGSARGERLGWIRGAVAVVGLVVVGVAALVLWVAQPWANHRPMQTWTEVARIRILGIDDREGLAEIFRNWEEGPPFRLLRAASSPHELPRALRPLDVRYELDGESRPLSEYLDRARVQGILAMYGGKVVFEQYRGRTTAESRYHLWSASKSFTGTIIGMAVHDGTIDSLDDPVSKYATDFAGTAYGDASIRHVMMMSSGVDFFHFEGFPDRNWMYLRVFRLQHDLDDFSAELGRRVPAGTDFNYLATDTHVLSAVLRGAYGEPYLQIVQDKLWNGLGIGGDALWSQNAPGPEGVAFGHCCLAARLVDFARLGEFHLRDGVWDGRRLVPEGWVEMVGTPNAPFQEPTADSSGYGMQFWVPQGYDGEFYGAGAFGQYLWIDTRREVVVAQFAAQLPGEVEDRERNAALRALVTAVRSPERHPAGRGGGQTNRKKSSSD